MGKEKYIFIYFEYQTHNSKSDKNKTNKALR